jgi:hypothetical protein
MDNNKFKFKKASIEDINHIDNLYKISFQFKSPFFKKELDFYTKKFSDDKLFENHTYICECNNTIIGYISFFILKDNLFFYNLKSNIYNFKLIHINEIFSFIEDKNKIDCKNNLNINELIYIFFVEELLKSFAENNFIITSNTDNIYNKFNFNNDYKILKKYVLNTTNNLDHELPVNQINIIDILNKLTKNKKYSYKIYDNKKYMQFITLLTDEHTKNIYNIKIKSTVDNKEEIIANFKNELKKNKDELLNNYIKNFKNELFLKISNNKQKIVEEKDVIGSIIKNRVNKDKKELYQQTMKNIKNEDIKRQINNK